MMDHGSDLEMDTLAYQIMHYALTVLCCEENNLSELGDVNLYFLIIYLSLYGLAVMLFEVCRSGGGDV